MEYAPWFVPCINAQIAAKVSHRIGRVQALRCLAQLDQTAQIGVLVHEQGEFFQND
jgi:hypothetical protein